MTADPSVVMKDHAAKRQKGAKRRRTADAAYLSESRSPCMRSSGIFMEMGKTKKNQETARGNDQTVRNNDQKVEAGRLFIARAGGSMLDGVRDDVQAGRALSPAGLCLWHLPVGIGRCQGREESAGSAGFFRPRRQRLGLCGAEECRRAERCRRGELFLRKEWMLSGAEGISRGGRRPG